MDLSISEQQEILLYKACKEHNGRLPVELARGMYSSKNTAHSAIDKLELAGYIEFETPGVWSVVKVTDDIKEELKNYRGQSSDVEEDDSAEVESNPADVDSSESGYEIQQVT